MGLINSRPRPRPRPPIPERGFIIPTEVKKNPPFRVITRPISKLDKRQQWQIIINKDKKTFTLKNVDTNTYLFLSQEQREGLSEYATIDLDNQNYKYDPAFVNITTDEIILGTEFSFISSFGTQLDIIEKDNKDKTNSNIKINSGLQKSIKGTRVRLTSPPNQWLHIFGVFIYSPNGKILNTNPAWAYSSSNYQNKYPASNAIKIVTENPTRKAYDAIQNKPLNNKNIGWNNWVTSPNSLIYVAHTNNNDNGVTGGGWWEYEFTDIVDISFIEIFGLAMSYTERLKNLRIEIFNDKKSRTNVIWTGSFGDVNKDAHKVFKISDDTNKTYKNI